MVGNYYQEKEKQLHLTFQKVREYQEEVKLVSLVTKLSPMKKLVFILYIFLNNA